jgi:excisionase family DNA binding protein
VRLRDDALTEIGRLFRAKLRALREQDQRAHHQAWQRSVASRRATRIQVIDGRPADDEILSTGDVARLLDVSTKTVARWATVEGLPFMRTLGGHRRFRWADVARWFGPLGESAR